MLDGAEVAKHNSRSSCWVIVNSQAYDVTEYLDRHPGGAQILLQYAGQDATAVYEPVHPKGTIERFLPSEKHLGPVDPTTFEPQAASSVSEEPASDQQLSKGDIPRLISLCMSLYDIESAAKRLISKPAWIYYNSAADGLGALENNALDWRKITLRPRLMRDVRRISTSQKALNSTLNFPFFIAPAARAGLAHEDGELCLARGAARKGIGYCVSSVASFPHNDISNAFYQHHNDHGALWFQLYIANEKSVTMERIQSAIDGNYSALIITIDSPVIGKREEDERYRIEVSAESLSNSFTGARTQEPPLAPPIQEDDPLPLRGVHSSTFNWDDLSWIRSIWHHGPIVLKGIQTAEDAVLAYRHNLNGIYLSNHGGRQCDDTPSSIATLLEIRKFYPGLIQDPNFEIFLDGGIRRGADVVKAICLGATACALGRPFMYSVAMGDEGVKKAIQILSDEIETTMRLIGATSVGELGTRYINTKRLEMELVDGLEDARLLPTRRRESKL